MRRHDRGGCAKDLDLHSLHQPLRFAHPNPLNDVFAIFVVLSASLDETVLLHHLGGCVVLRDDFSKNRFGPGAERLGDKQRNGFRGGTLASCCFGNAVADFYATVCWGRLEAAAPYDPVVFIADDQKAR
jgi:hypothetical protein